MDNKLKKLCQCVIEGELTTKILKEKCGIQGRYLNDLLEKKILVRIERGKYRLNDRFSKKW